jgi:hypothetical protein
MITLCQVVAVINFRVFLSTLALTSSVLLISYAQAQQRCDCSKKTATCQAAIGLSEKTFTLTSDTPQCSRLEWVVDGQARATTVMDGKASESRPTQKAHPDFWLKGCYVCADTKFAAGGKTSSAESTSANATVLGKWCTQAGKEKASYTITPETATTQFALGRLGRKFDKFSCDPSFTQCVGEIDGINNVLSGEGVVNFRYVYSVKTAEAATLVIERLNATTGKTLGSTTTQLNRCE